MRGRVDGGEENDRRVSTVCRGREGSQDSICRLHQKGTVDADRL